MATDSDEELTLSSSTLDALKAFYAERDDHAQRFADLQSAAETAADERAGQAAVLSMDTFTEDWNKSQFWYSDDTARLLARQLLDGAGPSSTVVVVSAPSVFVAIKNLVTHTPAADRPRLVLLEHDSRFTVFGSEFVFYDFNEPIKLPAALTARWLSKPDAKVIVCTGERMAPLITGKLYRGQGVQTTTFAPQHARGLSNEFYCYANFECADWTWRQDKSTTTA